MKEALEKFIRHLRDERNASPHTLRSYQSDLEQFRGYLAPPGAKPPALARIDHRLIREYIGHLHAERLEKSSIARKLAALRSFFKYCLRESLLQENPARLVATPKLPKRIPSVLSAEEINAFLDGLARIGSRPAPPNATRSRTKESESRRARKDASHLLLRRDRALLEMLRSEERRVGKECRL